MEVKSPGDKSLFATQLSMRGEGQPIESERERERERERVSVCVYVASLVAQRVNNKPAMQETQEMQV